MNTPTNSMTSSTSSISPVRFLVPVATVLAGAAVFAYAAVVAGRATPGAGFLGLAAAFLVLALFILYRAARALVEEPPPLEVDRASGRRKKELLREKMA